MKKIILILLTGMLPYLGFTQRWARINPVDTSFEVLNSANQVVYKSKFPQWFIFNADSIQLKAMDSSKLGAGSQNFLSAANSGFLKIAVLDSMFGRVKFYSRTGLVAAKPYKCLSDTITATNGNAFSIDISSAGFTRILAVQIQPESNTTDANVVPGVAIKSWTNSAIIVNVVNQSRIAVALLGLTISLGLQFVNNVKLHITVIGY